MRLLSYLSVSVCFLIGFHNVTFANSNDQIHTTLDPLVVTATKIPTKTSNVIAQTTVIDNKTLANFKGKTALEVLANQAGIGITQSGGMGATSNVYLRGYNGQNILVLIDGVRYGSATLGESALHLLPVEQIDRIEILYGVSGTSLYGADAVGGVIAIFGKGGVGTPKTGLTATLGAGSHKQYLASVGASFANASTSISANVSHNKTDGIDAIVSAKDWLGNSTLHDTDLDGYASKNASVSFAHRFDDKLSVGVNGMYNHSTTDIDSGSFANAHAKQKNGAVSGFVAYQGKIANTRLSLGQSQDKSTTYDEWSPNGGRFDTAQNHARLESQFKASDTVSVLAGVERLAQKVDSTQSYDVKKRNVDSGFVGYQITGKYYDAQGNLRLDNNSQFGEQTHYNVGVAIKPLAGVRFGANYATGFKVPTFNQLYWAGAGNPLLQPEYSKNSEVFAEYAQKIHRTRLTAYQNEVENKIVGFPASNVGKARMQGMSLYSDWRFKNGVSFGLGAEHLDAKNLSQKDINGVPYKLVYSPKNSYSAYVGYDNGLANIKLSAKQVGERFTNATNSEKLDAYTLFNLSGGYQITPRLRMDARIDNLTDENYTLSSQFGTVYNTDGRNYFGSITYRY